MLGIPTVVDRMLQQATDRILCNCYEMSFEESSYGFRPNRSAQQTVRWSLEYIKSGNTHIVDIDLKNFFDKVDHSMLLQILYRKVKCRPTLRMIRKWLRAPIQIDGKPVKRRRGIPHGSPLSPILSNIMLDELDRELNRTGVKYVRYADDFSIYSKEERESKEVRNRIRYGIWYNWKKPKHRCKSLIRMGVKPDIARKWSHTHMGSWATARSPILTTTITMSRLRRRGYESMTTVYESIAPHLNEPLYVRVAYTAVRQDKG
jgi:retron-type reverse transcriptase